MERNVGERLQALRQERDWKREKLAGDSGVSLGTIARFENGRYPNVENLIKIADCLGVPLDELVDRTVPLGHKHRESRRPRRGQRRAG